MADISAAAVKQLRELTGAGFMDCKSVLVETDGDLEAAVALLRERGQAAAAKKADRDAREGVIGTYIHTGGRFGAIVEVNCETDFVARNERFSQLVREIAIQIVALRPLYPTIDSVPLDVIAAKRSELESDPVVVSKPKDVRDRIVEGQLGKWYTDVVLYEQPFRDGDKRVGDVVNDAIATIGENIRVRRFVRFEVGEEL
ncbi:MAG TPA: translation elongation factor Ts [Candidatus Limnocylindrales bacterium]|nr:translation elongation factor Ts [Candidatus Limnocylindrales bacterium]